MIPRRRASPTPRPPDRTTVACLSSSPSVHSPAAKSPAAIRGFRHPTALAGLLLALVLAASAPTVARAAVPAGAGTGGTGWGERLGAWSMVLSDAWEAACQGVRVRAHQVQGLEAQAAWGSSVLGGTGGDKGLGLDPDGTDPGDEGDDGEDAPPPEGGGGAPPPP